MMSTSRPSSPRVLPIVVNGVLLVVVAGGAWQFLQWGDGGEQLSPDAPPRPRSPEVIRQDLFRSDATPLERHQAIQAWIELGAEAVPQLVNGLEADEPAVRRYNADALERIGPAARDAVPILRKLLHDDSLEVRRSAALALGSLDDHLEENVPVLVSFLKTEDESLISAARDVLVRTGVECIPEVCRVPTDGDSRLRKQCVYVLSQIGDSDPQAIAAIRIMLDDPELDIRRDAFHTLAGWDALTFEEVLAGLRGDDPPIMADAIGELHRFRSEIARALPELLSLWRNPPAGLASNSLNSNLELLALADPVSLWRNPPASLWRKPLAGLSSNSLNSILELLAMAGPAASAAVPDVQALLASDNGESRANAAQCLARIVTEEQEHFPHVRETLLDHDPWVAWMAGDALREYAPEPARTVVPELIEALQNGNVSAACALGGIGPVAEDAVPALIDALADPDSLCAYHAISALGRIGPAARSAVPRLIELLDYDFVREANRGWVARALGGIGPDAGTAVPELIAVIEAAKETGVRTANDYQDDVPHFVMGEAIIALGRMEIAARPAIPLLTAIARDTEAAGSATVALEALERIALADQSQRAAAAAVARAILKTSPSVDIETELTGVARLWVVAARLIARVGEPSPETISALTGALENPSPIVRSMAAFALGHMGPSARSARPALHKALNTPANALSQKWMPIGLLQSAEASSLFYDDDYAGFDIIPYPTGRRSVRFAVLEALKNLEPPSSKAEATSQGDPTKES